MLSWFTPKRRKALYSFTAAVVPLAVATAITLGWLSPESVDKFSTALAAGAALLTMFTNLLARANVNDQ